ncbi:hypothetical protein HGB07_02355 [Candidatus Roizmanbacteria bacterium]|nr:hypothetical protein [Candidatus Roizmanbacteria bacterium]
MDLFLYIALAAIYIMVVHFAMSMKGETSVFLMIGTFILGGGIGYFLGSYATGLLGAIVITLFLW